MTDSHQVLVYGYEVREDGSDGISLRVYDPNWPDRDDVTLVLDAAGVRQSTGEPLVALLLLD